MHELSICRSLVQQVSRLAARHHACGVKRIHLCVGPLSGVEVSLLRSAFPTSSINTVVAGAMLEIKETPMQVRCHTCGAVSDVTLNNLHCRHCDDWQTQLISGDEMLLESVELVS